MEFCPRASIRSSELNFQRYVRRYLRKHSDFGQTYAYEIVYPTRSTAGWNGIFCPTLFCGGQTYLLGKTHFRAACLVASICVLVLVVVTEAHVVINIGFLCIESTSLTACSQTFTQQDKLWHRHHQGKESVFKKNKAKKGGWAKQSTWPRRQLD